MWAFRMFCKHVNSSNYRYVRLVLDLFNDTCLTSPTFVISYSVELESYAMLVCSFLSSTI
jgi:hypothetical protein